MQQDLIHQKEIFNAEMNAAMKEHEHAIQLLEEESRELDDRQRREVRSMLFESQNEGKTLPMAKQHSETSQANQSNIQERRHKPDRVSI